MRKPYYRTARQCWYVKNSKGKAIRLDPDKEVAFEIWHKLVAAGIDHGPKATVAGLVDAFFDELDGTVSPDRMSALRYYASVLVMDFATVEALTIKPALIGKWLDSPKPGRESPYGEQGPNISWKSSSKRHAASLVKRIWKWAHNEGRIPKNTLASLKLTECEYRENVIDFFVHEKLVLHCRQLEDSRPFSLYLIASRCGARPQQIREVTAAEVNRECTQWHFKKHKTRNKTGKPLTVYLPPCLQTLTKILVAARPKGPLFLNSRGQVWKSDTVTQRMERLRTRLNLPDGTVAYLYRHAMATDALLAGVDLPVLAQMLGHTDTRMISKVYGHLVKHPGHIADAVAKMATDRIKPR